MTTNELLTKRYECIAPVPNMEEIQVGDILTPSNNVEEPTCRVVYNYDCNRAVIHPCFRQPLSAFPANFRRMHWSEGRAVEDMPEYVKVNKGAWQGVHKLDKRHGVWTPSQKFKGQWYTIISDGKTGAQLWAIHCLPATQTEYEAYQNSKAI